MTTWTPATLVADDRAHLLHPLQHPADHAAPHVWVKGRGAVLTDAEGREYLDGLACLWNVNVGHGRTELAEAAAAQMATLAYGTNYVGSSNVPAIRLAQRLTELAYPNLVATYFASGGAEANESAFKTARFYWKVKGQPQKVKIISRQYGYHGVTMAALSATAVPGYAKMFEPLVPTSSTPRPPTRTGSRGCARTRRWGRPRPACWRRPSCGRGRTPWPPLSPSRCRGRAASSSPPTTTSRGSARSAPGTRSS